MKRAELFVGARVQWVTFESHIPVRYHFEGIVQRVGWAAAEVKVTSAEWQGEYRAALPAGGVAHVPISRLCLIYGPFQLPSQRPSYA